ncbi:MAG: hypothetical protein Tsb002_37510 [Wenzhouxiangellaceae bacterium]
MRYVFVVAVLMMFSLNAAALPSHDEEVVYFEDSTMSSIVGEKIVALCGIGRVNQMIFGTTSEYRVVIKTPCPGQTPVDASCSIFSPLYAGTYACNNLAMCEILGPYANCD